jgi:hypothetical protein
MQHRANKPGDTRDDGHPCNTTEARKQPGRE